ncbi:helix-turn-helix transcriptional regulator [Clostridium sp. C2-6-12]|uniref:helix-turn-helix domain-containing protein n=1 Tax=Clostridium sp. C2-6-12 TaxID=2698832 RepID=UPI0013714366|nr:helix-turn-helix transcriptional regulator [Clostridium sp. C2-6-12]
MNIGKKIQTLRKQMNLSQEQLAEKLSVSRQAVSKWELDQSIPDTDKILEISKLFNVSTDYILNDEITNSNSTLTTQNIDYTSSIDNITYNTYKDFIGRWVKILLDDRAYGGLYQVAIHAVKKDFIIFEDTKGKIGIVRIDKIASISDSYIYDKANKKIPPITLNDKSVQQSLKYFEGKHCQLHLVCKSLLSHPQGYFDALVEKLSDDEILININQKKSMIRLEKLLVMVER